MTPEAFLRVIREQLDLVPWLHTINPAASASDLEAWGRAFPGYSLPEDLQSLYRQANGMKLNHIRYDKELVGEAFRVRTLQEIEPLVYAMCGRSHHRDPLAPRHWFAVGEDADAAFYVALDLKTGEYWTVPPVVPNEAEVIAQSGSEYLDWLMRFLPPKEELASLFTSGTA